MSTQITEKKKKIKNIYMHQIMQINFLTTTAVANTVSTTYHVNPSAEEKWSYNRDGLP